MAAEIDPGLIERVTRWCAEAGRRTGEGDIRAALSPLGWDELLSVRALLADPPPARPLGPHALVDIARGAPPDLAAERQREGRYPDEEETAAGERGGGRGGPAAVRRGGGEKKRDARFASVASGVVVHRASDRTAAAAPLPDPDPRAPVDVLFRPEGRAVLERLVRRAGARRAALVAALAAGFRGRGDVVPDERVLDALLDHHGLARAFARRERDEALHSLRAAAGVRSRAAARLGLDPGALDAALARLGASAEAERIREERRTELRARATLTERVRLVLEEEERLADLGLLGEFEADLRARLPEHLRALRTGREPIRVALARTLSLRPPLVDALARRFGMEVGKGAEPVRRPPPPRKARGGGSMPREQRSARRPRGKK